MNYKMGLIGLAALGMAALAAGCQHKLEYTQQANGIMVPVYGEMTGGWCNMDNGIVMCVNTYDRDDDGKNDLILAEMKLLQGNLMLERYLFADNSLDGILDTAYIDNINDKKEQVADGIYDRQTTMKEMFPNKTGKDFEVETFAKDIAKFDLP